MNPVITRADTVRAVGYIEYNDPNNQRFQVRVVGDKIGMSAQMEVTQATPGPNGSRRYYFEIPYRFLTINSSGHELEVFVSFSNPIQWLIVTEKPLLVSGKRKSEILHKSQSQMHPWENSPRLTGWNLGLGP